MPGYIASCDFGHDHWECFSEKQANAVESATEHNLIQHQSIGSWEMRPEYKGGGCVYFATVKPVYVNVPF